MSNTDNTSVLPRTQMRKMAMKSQVDDDFSPLKWVVVSYVFLYADFGETVHKILAQTVFTQIENLCMERVKSFEKGYYAYFDASDILTTIPQTAYSYDMEGAAETQRWQLLLIVHYAA